MLDNLIYMESSDNEIDGVSIETARNQENTITINGERKEYLHSKFNPSHEAEVIVAKHSLNPVTSTLVVIGAGLGYHMEAFLNKYSNIKLIIVEFEKTLYDAFVENNVLSEANKRRVEQVYIGKDSKMTKEVFFNILNNVNNNVSFFALPAYVRVMKENVENFYDSIEQAKKMVLQGMVTELRFQGLWTMNALLNFHETVQAGNLLEIAPQYCKDKPLIIVSAGPSLNFEIDYLRKIRENNMAYIFAVGSSVNTLITNGIKPHASCAIDPLDPNTIDHHVFRILNDNSITDVPFIFGTSVGEKTLENYIGPKWRVITSQDSISSYLLDEEMYLSDATTVAAFVLQLGLKLGFGPIILAGQNLAYLEDRRYSEGIYYAKSVNDEEIDKGTITKDVYGDDVTTNYGFLQMKRDIETYVSTYRNRLIINTTHKGAEIEGTKFMRLSEVIDQYLIEQDIDTTWLQNPVSTINRVTIISKVEEILEGLDEAIKSIKSIKRLINTLRKRIKQMNFNGIDLYYTQLNTELRTIEENNACVRLLLPLNRQEYKNLVSKIAYINTLKDPLQKTQIVIEYFEKLVGKMDKDIPAIKGELINIKNICRD